MTYFNTQIDNEKNTYSIQFETDDKQLFKIVEETCRKAVDVSRRDKNGARNSIQGQANK